MTSFPVHPRIALLLAVSGALAEAAEIGARRAAGMLRTRRPYGSQGRKAGIDTPMWNVCVVLLRQETRKYGTKARLARYLGIPRQRLQDYLRARSRLPDAEIALRLQHWLAERQAGRDPSI